MDVREKLVELLDNFHRDLSPFAGNEKLFVVDDNVEQAEYLIAHGVTVIPPEGIGEMSDGYHTFNELYHHRAVLFSVICNAMPYKAWKSKRHDTGDMYDGMFIVGIETNRGQATYHYDVDPYWDMFNVPELEYAPKWDGHTPQEAINRIAHGVTMQEWISVKERLPKKEDANPNESILAVAKEDGFARSWVWDIVARYPQEFNHWMPLPQPPQDRVGILQAGPMTNADRIRAMSDEELAERLCHQDILCKANFCQSKSECERRLCDFEEIPKSECVQCAIEWLRQPAEGSNT